MDPMQPLDDLILFQAEVTPHRSLSSRGLRVIIAFVCVVGLGTTTLFWAMGAWPIAGFNGVEILLAIVLLREHQKSARAKEILWLSEAGLRIRRVDARGRTNEFLLPAGWLNVVLAERPGRVPGLYLAARGAQVEVAMSLGEPEKRDLAEALAGALHRVRNPVFDNPQLRSARG
jgi:uncharacterized membrane protein